MSSDADPRVERIVDLVMQLAAGELSARVEPSEAGDDLDAIILGVNMLAEDLHASLTDLEHRVEARTAEIQQLNFEIMKLTELGNLLQACETRGEAYAVMRQGVSSVFARLSGEVYVFNASRNGLERKVTWGTQRPEKRMVREDCWGLRRGQPHLVRDDVLALPCAHVAVDAWNSVCVPMSARGETIGLLHLTSRRDERTGALITDGDMQLGVAVATQLALALANLELRHTLREQALRDPLTGLYNRRFLEDWIGREVNRAEHAGTSLGIIMGDIDHFKQVNDVYGHDAGDRVLKLVGETISTSLRAGDVPCRYGGEEFLILLTDISRDNLMARAEALRADIAARRIPTGGVPLSVQMSMGLALYPEHGQTPDAVLKAADDALYSAKQAGRNRAVIADPPAIPEDGTRPSG